MNKKTETKNHKIENSNSQNFNAIENQRALLELMKKKTPKNKCIISEYNSVLIKYITIWEFQHVFLNPITFTKKI